MSCFDHVGQLLYLFGLFYLFFIFNFNLWNSVIWVGYKKQKVCHINRFVPNVLFIIPKNMFIQTFNDSSQQLA